MEKFDIKSFAEGYLEALCAPARQFPNREPVAFLYGHVAKEGETPTHTINGVGYVGAELPALPVEDANWDVETYPYVFIYRMTSTSNTILVCSSGRSFFSYNGHNKTEEFGFGLQSQMYVLENDSFVYYHDLYYVAGWTEDKVQLIWTNHDVLKDDGSVYMAAGYTDYPDAPPIPAEVVVADPCPDKSIMYLFDNATTAEVGDTVELPAIPQIDMRLFPYLALCSKGRPSTFGTAGWMLVASRYTLWDYRSINDSYRYHKYCFLNEAGTEWGEWVVDSTSYGPLDDCSVDTWANYDVYDGDGNRVISASDPHPNI